MPPWSGNNGGGRCSMTSTVMAATATATTGGSVADGSSWFISKNAIKN